MKRNWITSEFDKDSKIKRYRTARKSILPDEMFENNEKFAVYLRSVRVWKFKEREIEYNWQLTKNDESMEGYSLRNFLWIFSSIVLDLEVIENTTISEDKTHQGTVKEF